MATEIFYVTNVKCMGCVTSIQEGLTKLQGVLSVTVEKEEAKVIVETINLKREKIAEELSALGYPEKKKSFPSIFK